MSISLDSIWIAIPDDTCGDTSWLGEFTDDVEPGLICCQTGEFYRWHFGEAVDVPPKGREYRSFRPYAGGEKPGTKRYRKYAMQDWRRMDGLQRGEWSFIGIEAGAVVGYEISDGGRGGGGVYRGLETLTSGGLWGIESDSGDHLKEVAGEELAGLRKHLTAFGVTIPDTWSELCAGAIDGAGL